MYERKVNITRVKKDKKLDDIDVVLIESPIDIYVNSNPIANIICLPNDLKELAVGFIYSLGIINSFSEIRNLKVNEIDGDVYIDLINPIKEKDAIFELNTVSRVIDTTCGIPSPWRKIIKNKIHKATQSSIKNVNLKIKKEIIFSSIIKMQKETRLFRQTGGCHGAAIFDLNGTLVTLKEDIGRHNALDKVVGTLLIANNNFEDKILTTTGRLTGDSVLKAIRARIPVLASISAAIESGIRLAFAYGLTLIGFVRGSKMNIYSHPERIIV